MKNKTTQIHILATPEEKKIIADKAWKARLSVSKYMIESAIIRRDERAKDK